MLSYGRIGTGNIDAIAMLPPKEIGECLQLTSQYTATRHRYGFIDR